MKPEVVPSILLKAEEELSLGRRDYQVEIIYKKMVTLYALVDLELGLSKLNLLKQDDLLGNCLEIAETLAKTDRALAIKMLEHVSAVLRENPSRMEVFSSESSQPIQFLTNMLDDSTCRELFIKIINEVDFSLSALHFDFLKPLDESTKVAVLAAIERAEKRDQGIGRVNYSYYYPLSGVDPKLALEKAKSFKLTEEDYVSIASSLHNDVEEALRVIEHIKDDRNKARAYFKLLLPRN